MSEDNFERFVKCAVEVLAVEPSDITLDARFADTPIEADSLDLVELVMALEEEFGIDIPDDAAEQIATVQSAVDYIKEAQAA